MRNSFTGRKLIIGLFVSVLLTFAGTAAAANLWTLDGVTFDDGGTAVGSFVFGVIGGVVTVTNVDIQTMPGSSFAGATYNLPAFDLPENGIFQAFVTDNEPGLQGETGVSWAVSQSLISPGIVDIRQGDERLCLAEAECGEGAASEILREIVGGQLIGVEIVPIPAAVWLFGSALGLLGWLKRRTA